MRLHRVFCSTPGDLESERLLFQEAVARVNESAPLNTEHLLVPVSVLPNMARLDLFHPVLEQNVRECHFFLQIFNGTWGPPHRNFQPYFQLALRALDDPQLPTRAVACAVGPLGHDEPSFWPPHSHACTPFLYAHPQQMVDFLDQTLQIWLAAATQPAASEIELQR